MLLARIHNPASRGSPMTFQLRYALQHPKDGCMLSVCYFISLKRKKLDGQAASEILLNIIGTKSFPRRKQFKFQNSEIGDCMQTVSLALHHYHLQCHYSFTKTFKTQEIRIKQQIPPLYKALCSHLPNLLVSTLLSLYLSADTGRIAGIHPNSVQGFLQSKNLCIY